MASTRSCFKILSMNGLKKAFDPKTVSETIIEGERDARIPFQG